MKKIVFSQHALEQMPDRGATREEVEITIREGEITAAKTGKDTITKQSKLCLSLLIKMIEW